MGTIPNFSSQSCGEKIYLCNSKNCTRNDQGAEFPQEQSQALGALGGFQAQEEFPRLSPSVPSRLRVALGGHSRATSAAQGGFGQGGLREFPGGVWGEESLSCFSHLKGFSL